MIISKDAEKNDKIPYPFMIKVNKQTNKHNSAN